MRQPLTFKDILDVAEEGSEEPGRTSLPWTVNVPAIPPQGMVPLCDLLRMYGSSNELGSQSDAMQAIQAQLERDLARIDELSVDEIRSLRRRFAAMYHPDRAGRTHSGRMASINRLIDETLAARLVRR